MRLIDADKIALTDFEIIMCNGDYKEALKMLLEKINNQPPVKAIPIEAVEQILSEIDLQLDETGAYDLQVAKVQRYIRDNIRGLKEQ